MRIESVRRMRAIVVGIALASAVWAPWSAGAAEAGHDPVGDGVSVEHAEIVVSPPGGMMMAGYLAIWNGTQGRMDLTAVESADFGSVSLHRAESADGVARMRPFTDFLPIPGHSELLMKQAGIHLVLSDPKRSLTANDSIALSLVFQDGTRLEAAARVLAPGDAPTDHHHGQGDGKGHK